MDLKSLSNDQLIQKTEQVVRVERASTSEVVRHFQEISDRKLYLERGYPNLFEMAIKHFGYCAGSAMRRINSMKLIRELPEVEAKLESGELTLSAASEMQSFFYAQARSDQPYSRSAKMELVESCLNKSRREVERELASRNPARVHRDESMHALSETRLRLNISISNELNEKFQKLKILFSHIDPTMTTEALLDRLADLGLEKYDPLHRTTRKVPPAEVTLASIKAEDLSARRLNLMR